MTTITYRAAYWLSDDKQADVRLTTEDQQHLSEHKLIEAAKAEAEKIGLDLAGGEIVVGQWTE